MIRAASMLNSLRLLIPVRFLLVFFLFVIAVNHTQAQPTFNMSNQTVDDCEGTLLDSDAGPNGVNYDHGENAIFTICIPDADTILISFSSFCTEEGFDSLRIFNGPDTSAPQLGPAYSGDPVSPTGTIPGTIIANSGCMTLHFESDANVACDGWTATWQTIIEEPEPPDFAPIPNPPCFSNSLNLQIDKPVSCDSVYAGAFNLSGPNAPSIVSATPTNCQNDTTSSFSVTFGQPISESGVYDLSYTSHFRDACDSLWKLTAQSNFVVNDCPIDAWAATNPDTICQGGCADLFAGADGGDSTTYTYNWSNGFGGGSGPNQVCPATTTTYSVTVDDAGPAASDVANVSVVVQPLPTMPSDCTVCQSASAFNLSASPPGGVWSGNGIVDTNNGRFHPGVAKGGTHTINYESNGCSNSMTIDVTPIWAGAQEAACPGSAPFTVSGGFPSGGIWSGPNIQPNGTFDPSTPGSYTATYSVNGCTDTKTVNVGNINLQPDDTTCTSIGIYQLSFSPDGGTWSGPGIVDADDGEFDAENAGAGNHTLTYTIQGGCQDSVQLFVKAIDGGGNRLACPDAAPFQLTGATPPGGYWTGTGVIDTAAGLYDPGANGGSNFNDDVVYHQAGCTDTFRIRVRKTEVRKDTLRFCPSDTITPLNWRNVRRRPGNGDWSGPGVIDPDRPGLFDPSVAGAGTHTLYYDANGCRDSIVIKVFPTPSIDTVTDLCPQSSPLQLTATPSSNGIWVGTGVVDTATGLFDPGVAGLGVHRVYFASSPLGCLDSMDIAIQPKPNVQLSGLPQYVCFRDTNYVVQGTPQGGTLTGNGVSGMSFNPKQAGPGQHTLTYEVGSGDCSSSSTISVNVFDSISLSTNWSDTTLCFDDNVRMTANASGGNGSIFTYSWNNGLPSGYEQTVFPPGPTTYSVTASDGCSEPVSKSFQVSTHPEITFTERTNAPKCSGDTGFAAVSVTGANNYSIHWPIDSTNNTDTLFAPVNNTYDLMITDNNTGCKTSGSVSLPGFERVTANFRINPSDECVDVRFADVEFIDLSQGAAEGKWRFGDGQTKKYLPGKTTTHTYSDTGNYRVTLSLDNNNGCRDTIRKSVCIEPFINVMVPKSFSPNGDGINDRFRVQSIGVTDFEMKIFSRWGELLFQTNDINKSWDGEHEFSPVQTGGYVYLIRYKSKAFTGWKTKKGTVILLR